MLNYAAGTSVVGYNLTRSLRFRASASAYLSKTFSNPPATGLGRTWTLSKWVKRGALGSAQNLFSSGETLNTAGSVEFNFNSNNTVTLTLTTFGLSVTQLITTQVFRDPSAWYHIVLAIDTTQATASNRAKIYVNGTQVTAFSTANYPAQNEAFTAFTNYPQNIGRIIYNGTGFFDGYMTEIVAVDGQALTPASFGSTNALTGVWQPAPYTGTYGTNGFYLPFTDNSTAAALGTDFSGNGNTWTVNNISVTAGVTYDSMTDVPTLTSATAANYCVLNAVNQPTSTTLSDGNLRVVATTAAYRLTQSTFTLTSGKYYFEMTKLTASNYVNGLGLVLPTVSKDISTPNATGVYAIFEGNLNTIQSYTNGGGAVLISTANWSNNDIIQCAYDATTGKIWFGRNGTWYPATNGGTIGDPALGTNQTVTGVSGLTPTVISYDTSSSCAINFGQRPFTYTPPTGFVALNAFNLPAATIVKGNTVMDATLYTGNGTTQTITNAAGFRPDLVWVKVRSAVDNHKLTDSVRGVTKGLISNSTGAETTDTNGLTAFNSNGWSLGSDTAYNTNGSTYVGWQWQAGQGSSSSNTNGTITSQVSANASAGFSVVTYNGNATAGATVGHGLGVAPSFVIAKARGVASSWSVYHSALGASQYILLNTTAAAVSSTQEWGGVAPTSSVITIGNASANNNQATSNVLYAFAQIAGYSAFGKYQGNSSADGVFVYTGFRPKFVVLRPYDGAADWILEDTSRSSFNVASATLYPNSSGAEASGTNLIDFLSNGFKIRTASGNVNSSSNNYLYACFAENPFKFSLAR